MQVEHALSSPRFPNFASVLEQLEDAERRAALQESGEVLRELIAELDEHDRNIAYRLVDGQSLQEIGMSIQGEKIKRYYKRGENARHRLRRSLITKLKKRQPRLASYLIEIWSDQHGQASDNGRKGGVIHFPRHRRRRRQKESNEPAKASLSVRC